MKNIFIILLLLPTLSYANCSLSVRVYENKPQFYQDSQGVWHGLAVELVSALFKQANCTINFKPLSWKRSLYLLEHGGLDVLLNMSKTEDRQKFTHFIGPMSDEKVMITVEKNTDYKITTLEDIKSLPKRIGLVRGGFYGKEFAQKIKTDSEFANKFEYATSQQNFNKLKHHRVIGVMGDSFFASHKINTMLPKEKFKLHPYIFNESYIYFGFSKKGVDQQLRKHFEKAYAQLKVKNAFSEIIAKYR